jgi:hypothetical protein
MDAGFYIYSLLNKNYHLTVFIKRFCQLHIFGKNVFIFAKKNS